MRLVKQLWWAQKLWWNKRSFTDSPYDTQVHNPAFGWEVSSPPTAASLSATIFWRFWCTALLDGVCDVEKELHVHGSLWYAGTPSVDDGDERAVQFVHVALGQQPASTASLVLHLHKEAEEKVGSFWEIHTHKRILIRGYRSYHVSLCWDAESEWVDASRGENSQVRRQSAAGSQSDFLLEAAAGRQHRLEGAFCSLELVKHLRGHSHICPAVSWSRKHSVH